MNDTHLAIGCYPGGSSFKVLELSTLSSPSYQTVPGQDCPSEVSFNDKGFFIPGNDNIVGWNSVADALAGSSPTMSFGGRTDKSNMGTKMAFWYWLGWISFLGWRIQVLKQTAWLCSFKIINFLLDECFYN